MLEILYEDDAFIAINKPAKLLVHRSEIDRHETRFAIQLLRDQINRKVIPVHRLDKGTSGVLLFAFEPETVSAMADVFAKGLAKKDYMAVVRGWAPESLMLDHPIVHPLAIGRIADDRMIDVFEVLANLVTTAGHGMRRH